ncbi:DUF4202 domain-containing protein [Saccharophagus sp. K07]|jgi:hypothetical protein|uniref:DUF4202 domain-containing protein n=1 Tax=Saccharophagus sp. K07 TaxID=2283636 RepID=UPI0016525336|nr:DUF4202 domain-containing protein [Saccharophagus sp. K07]MBC6906807.1 DUF4202 domain-containing protein [Saccharophagus sp. K07]
MPTPFAKTIALIDAANLQDPNLEQDGDKSFPKEFLYSERMTRCLLEFRPDASEHLQIAVRGQHIERWTSPRSAYPEGRTGYKKWRAELGLFHARRVGELMHEAGYSEEDIKRTQYIVQKRGLGRDAETQTLEDVACLVFIRHYLEDFASKHDEEKLIDIIKKTWAKMSADAHNAALQIPLKDDLKNLVVKALAP